MRNLFILFMSILLLSCVKEEAMIIQENSLNEEVEIVAEQDEEIVKEEALLTDNKVSSQDVGSNYCGPYTVTEPFSLIGLKDTIISGLDISNPNGIALNINSCENVIIENCYLHDSSGNGIQIFGSTNIIIRNNRMESISTGVYAQVSEGIQVVNNDIKNVLGPFPRGQFVQFAGGFGANNKINDNAFQNIEGESYGEDAINLFNCNGTSESPIEVRGNWIKNFTPSLTGGGIMTGDSGGSHILVSDNILVDSGPYGYGIGIASGTDIVIEDNTLVGRNKLNQYVPIFMTNFYESAQSCSGNTIRNNKMSWQDEIDRFVHIGYRAELCGEPYDVETNIMEDSIDVTALPEDIFGSCGF